MAFTDHTWSVGETLTAANMNGLRDNFRLMAPHLIVRKPSDESVTSSTVMQNDDHLLLPLGANEVWLFELMLKWTDTTAAAGIKIHFSVPASGVFAASCVWKNSGGTLTLFAFDDTSLDQSLSSPSSLTSGNLLPIHGLVVNSSTAGNLTFRWAQATSNGTATIVKANSTLWAVKLA